MPPVDMLTMVTPLVLLCKAVAHVSRSLRLLPQYGYSYPMSTIDATAKARMTKGDAALLALFDDAVKTKPFAESRAKVGSLKKREMTEREIVAEAMRLMPGLTATRLVKDGALSYAREIIRMSKSSSPFRPGAADKRIEAAYKSKVSENAKRAKKGLKPLALTYTTLGLAAKTKPQTAKSWIERFHPELLATP